MEQTGEPIIDTINSKEYHKSTPFLYGVDLFNNKFFWESHVWWEALWNHEGRKGKISDLLKGLIKMAAAGIKFKQKHDKAARGHCSRAAELFISLGHEKLLGLNIKTLITMAQMAHIAPLVIAKN